MESKPTEKKDSSAPTGKVDIPTGAKKVKEEKKSNSKAIFIVLIALLALGSGAVGGLWCKESATM